MPYEWTSPPGATDAPRAELQLWPYRSLPRRGMVIFIGITVALVSLPLLAVVGSPVLWGLLPFIVAAIAGLWWAIERSYSDGSVLETLLVWPDRVTLTRRNPRGPRQDWEANPYWVEVCLHEDGGPVETYITLRGAGREVEIGAFLTPEERKALYPELRRAMTRNPV
ncbi:DUF2244 domain-containing protein [Pelagovum pacificum]|uniref:DUF2244 domain-containing protein n=1 Tax=Pelagovum pacificum TaxID=2588711 RepID=A0A5C5GB06_9RHOB|nr:DUF2244 domain-containing protein [Pelagovum pacificum]QQA42053.1 DUF2244 domain-containing protein [Pelagovum pacificum]TNY31142.1 DUF2244 domain-containing protein [Pelagovum pacificum]